MRQAGEHSRRAGQRFFDRRSGHPIPAATPWVAGTWRERLVLGGSETSPSEPGYLAGAVDAATQAVNETLRLLEKSEDGGGGA